MALRRCWVPLAVAVATASACARPAPTQPRPLPSGVAAATTSPNAFNQPGLKGGSDVASSASAAPLALASPGTTPVLASPGPGATPGLVGRTPAVTTLVGDNGGGLVGKVKAPVAQVLANGATIIANNGGTMIANNGASIIANNGGSYRLLAALEQKPLAGVTITLVDAAGTPYRDAAGAPLTAVTDAAGGYAFAHAPASVAVVLRIDLGAAGTLEAVAPHDLPAGSAVDVDLVSTGTFGLVLLPLSSQS